VQLNAFMARALGHSHFAGIDGTNLKGVARPGQTMAEKLMEALLTSGGSINLADKSHEQPGREFEALQAIAMLSSDLLAAFNARYAATTLTHMTERQVRLRQAPEGAAGLRRSTYPDAVGAYAEEAADMQDDAEEASGRKRADPNQTLVAAAMGTAMGGALRVHWAGKDPARNREANLGFQLVRNGAMTVKGCIDQLKRDELTTRGTIMSVFSKAMGVAGNLSAVATPAARGLATVGLNFLSRCLAGEAEDGRTELIDRFDGALQAMVQAQGLIALHKEQLLDCFSSEVR
jgi:hypothetical protein